MQSEIPSHTRVKICGLTSTADAVVAVNCGADAIGLVFFDKSSRNIPVETAQKIVGVIGPFVTSVGLFVNPEKEFVEKVLAKVPLQLLQFHGDESADFCEQFNRPYIKALRVKNTIDGYVDGSGSGIKHIKEQIIQEAAEYQSAQGILLDTYSEKGRGGTGEAFNWDCVPRALAGTHIILAGGLHPLNVAQAIRATQPYAVDVSSGVEASPGKKDSKKMADFIAAVQNKS